MMRDYLEEYPPVLSVNDTARILGVTERTVRRLVNDGMIKCIRIGRLIKIPKDVLVSYLEEEVEGR